jgi:hypothetical protein
MNVPKIAVMAGAYFPKENWFYKNNRIHLPVWIDHFKEQTPNSETFRFIISDGGSHPKLNNLNGENFEVYLDGPHGEFYNFKYLCSKLKDEEYVIYMSNDMIIRNIEHEDWVGKCIELLHKYNPVATSIWSGGVIGSGAWDYQCLLEPNVYKMGPFSTQFLIMKRETVNEIKWDYIEDKVRKSELGHWEAWFNESYVKDEHFKDMMYVTYTHERLGSITLGEYSPQKVNSYKNTTTFFKHDY